MESFIPVLPYTMELFISAVGILTYMRLMLKPAKKYGNLKPGNNQISTCWKGYRRRRLLPTAFYILGPGMDFFMRSTQKQAIYFGVSQRTIPGSLQQLR